MSHVVDLFSNVNEVIILTDLSYVFKFDTFKFKYVLWMYSKL